MRRAAAIGLRAKTGRAIAVVLAEDEDGPVVVRREELRTFDPEVPGSKQPHHAGLELEPEAAVPIVEAAERAAKEAAATAFRALVDQLAADGMKVMGVGVVGPPAKGRAQLRKIGNEHVRAHAAEGQLFRAVLEQAARSKRLPSLTLSDRAGFEEASLRMGCNEKPLRRQVDALGKEIGPPWRADEKLACAAALAVLSQR